jgi:tRNA(Ile)-lysidine synthase
MLKEILLKTITNTGMLREGDGVVVAFSGGGDSTALLHALASMRSEFKIKLFACHLNHKIRGAEADEDARFCREFADKLGIPIYIKEMDIAGIAAKRGWNIEEAGRNARTAFYRRAMRHFGADKTATAHHMHDQAETFLINLLRGSGETGLGGIAPIKDGWLIRPLIKCPKSEIERYLKENDIPFRTDETNVDTTIIRNRIRLMLIPLLEKDYNPRIVNGLSQTSDIFRGADDLSAELADAFFRNIARRAADSVSFERHLFTLLPIHLKRILIRKAFAQAAGSRRRLSFEQVEDILNAVRASAKDLRISLPFGFEAKIGESKIRILPAKKNDTAKRFEYAFEIPGEMEIPEIGRSWLIEIKNYTSSLLEEAILNPLIGIFDAEKISSPVTVRNRRDGDRMQPLGMQGTKKLQDIFTDKKIPKRRREELPVFTSGGEIFWIPGVASGERFKVSDKTKKVAVFAPIR